MSKEIESNHLFVTIKQLIEQNKQQIAISVNASMSILYWQIGKQVNEVVLKNQRAEYGKKIVVSLARQLETEYGTSFSDKNLRRMMQFALVFLTRKLYTHCVEN